MDPLDEQHARNDRARAGQQRGAQRDERHVDPLALRLGGLTRLTGQQLEGHEQEQQAAGSLQGRQLHAQVGQDLPAEQGESQDHAERDQRGLPGQAVPLPGLPAARSAR